MGFTGDLRDISIVDVIQLLHATRKSGTLRVKGAKGESRVIFSNGYIVGANHLNNSVRIGSTLVKMKVITPEVLEQGLEIQKEAGKNRKPLLATLIEMGKVKKEEAFRSMKKLIELTIVELVGWSTGTFTLDTEAIVVTDECRYFPKNMSQAVSLDTQMVLMDALRIFDEQQRGRQPEDVVPSDETNVGQESDRELSADDLGLADVDQLEHKIPEPFSGIETSDLSKTHQQKIKWLLADFSAEEQDALISFLEKFSLSISAVEDSSRQEGQARVVILFSRDELLKHCLKTVFKNEGILLISSDEEDDLDRKLTNCLSLKIAPLLTFDSPEESPSGLSRETIAALQQQEKGKYPRISKIQLVSLIDNSFSLQSFDNGVRALFPKPSKEQRKETFIKDTMEFLETFRAYAKSFFFEQGELLSPKPSSTDILFGRIKDCVTDLRGREEAPEVVYALHGFASEMFERTVTFYVRKTDIMGVRGTGINAEKRAGATPAMKLKIPLSEPSVIRDVIEEGGIFFGESDDKIFKEHLFREIGAPLRSTMLLLAMRSRGKSVTLTYADFGLKEPSSVQIDALEIIAGLAGLALENAIYRKRFATFHK